MIISASRRTDIPAYYSEWFFNRLREGYVCVRNPVNASQIRKISLSPDVVDGLIFWTKNPMPMMDQLYRLEKYNYYFQFTLTSYGKDIETNLPSKKLELIPAFRRLSEQIGRERVLWRYDPIFLNDIYTMEYHKKYFRTLAGRLGDYTEKCTVSFLDLYRNIQKNISVSGIRTLSCEEQLELLTEFSFTAEEYGFTIDTCAEENDFSRLGIAPARCINHKRLERLNGIPLDIGKDPNQRTACGCVSSIDIGAYGICPNGCVYCYANHSLRSAVQQLQRHDPQSSLLAGTIGKNDAVTELKTESCVRQQMTIFEV